MSRCGIRLTGCLPQWWKWAGININAACWHYCIAVNFFLRRSSKNSKHMQSMAQHPFNSFQELICYTVSKGNADDEWLVFGGNPL